MEALKENIVTVIIASASMATDHLAMVIVTKALDKKNRKCLAKVSFTHRCTSN